MLNITNHQGNASRNHNEIITSHLLESYHQKRQEITNVEEDVENVNWCSHYGKQYGVSSKKKTKNKKLLFDPAIPFLVIYPKEVKTGSQKDVCAPMFTIHNSQDMEITLSMS